MVRLVKSFGALVVLVALLAGIPALLAGTIGNPLNAWPDLRVGDLTDTVLIDMMSVVVWIAWAQFALSVVAETLAVARQLPHSVRLPLVPEFDRHCAHVLVASILLFGTGATTLIAPMSVASATPPAQPTSSSAWVDQSSGVGTTARVVLPAHDAIATARGDVDRRQHATTYVVPGDGAGPDTYWDIADAHLGHGREWQAVWELNRGRTQADGTVMSDPGLLRPGWTVLLPPRTDSDSVTDADEVTVERGDSLTSIAHDHGVADWRRAWQVSRGMTEPDGERFVDPDLIRPGWTVRMPNEPDDSSTESLPRTDAPTSKPSGRPHAEGLTPIHRGPLPPLPPKPDSPTPTPPSQRTGPTSTPAARPGQHDGDPFATAPHSHRTMVAFLGGGALLAGLSLAALLRHRRRQFRWRRPGRLVAATPRHLVDVERQVLASGSAGIGDVAWLDHALRSLGSTLASAQAEPPDILAARLTASGLELVLANPRPGPPEPWYASDDAMRWAVEREILPVVPEAEREHRFALYPTLVSVGYTERGDYWLLNLERVGAVSLVGDVERCLDLARFVAAELAHNTWSEMLHVTMVGFGEEMVAMNPDRLSFSSDAEDAVVSIQRQLNEVRDAAREAGVDPLSDRLGNVLGDVWATRVVLLASHAGEHGAGVVELLSEMREHGARAAVALVLTEDTERASNTRWQLTVDSGGILRIPALNIELVAHRLPAGEATDLALLLAQTSTTDDRPMPASRDADPLSTLADAAGGLLSGTPTDDLDAVNQTPSSLESSTGDETEVELSTSDVARNTSQDADPQLDADLADWRDPSCPRPKVQLLGPIVVTAHGVLPSQSPRLAWNTEVVTYLATHPSGVSAERFGTDLWPDDPEIAGKTKIRQAIMIARRWLGADPHGVDYLPRGTTSVATGGVARYEVRDALVDADLFRRLRVRGLARGADGVDDLWRALSLVRGTPFTERRPGGYSWLAEDATDHIYAAMIADTAHTVATHYLEASEPDRAAAAARVAVAAGSSEDTPLLDLLLASDALGDLAESERLMRRILDNHDAEVEEDLPPHTFAILLHRRPGEQ